MHTPLSLSLPAHPARVGQMRATSWSNLTSNSRLMHGLVVRFRSRKGVKRRCKLQLFGVTYHLPA